MQDKVKNSRIPQIDFLRVIGCTWLVFYHYRQAFGMVPNDNSLWGIFVYYGYLGVEFFFMISGFLMSLKYRNSEIDLKSYIVKRIGSWYLLYVVSVIINCILEMIGAIYFDGVNIWPLDKPLNLYYLLTSLLLIHNGWLFDQNSPYGSGAWFLDVLVLVYLIYFIINKKTKGENRKYIMVCLAMIMIGWYGCTHSISLPFLYTKSCRGYLSFFVGVLVAELYKYLKEKKVEKKYAKIVGTILLFVFIIEIMSRIFQGDSCFGNIQLFCTVFIFPATIFCVVILADKYTFPISRKLGKLTMSIYMTHALSLAIVGMYNYKNNVMNYAKWGGCTLILFIIFVNALIFDFLVETLLQKKLSKSLGQAIEQFK